MATKLVHVFEGNSNKILHSSIVSFRVVNTETTAKEFENLAWETAIDDGNVPPDAKRSNYRIVLAKAINPFD